MSSLTRSRILWGHFFLISGDIPGVAGLCQERQLMAEGSVLAWANGWTKLVPNVVGELLNYSLGACDCPQVNPWSVTTHK